MKNASVANKGVVTKKCAIGALAGRTPGTRRARSWQERVGNKIEGGGYPIPGILQSVRKRLISRELEETVALKCEASVRKEKETKELEKIREVEEAAWAAAR
jgi:hypothetical protein